MNDLKYDLTTIGDSSTDNPIVELGITIGIVLISYGISKLLSKSKAEISSIELNGVKCKK